ncbi:zinc knuckle-domain-containing protein [Schizothecium vesticola]|uniref:Zinc knuckle-domain-containing protein n=1 Tax=Schizothecium vesticola TaxID=314040 RepID=A0AA40EKM5_9PEZI|nr:zinc knuckle-domain-containing protein [Schizothecium vesticola]
MFARGRSGPSKAPSTVQCQKCLKRGHYSYECKAAPQERPYVARPSRTQQLFNPKLMPKLTNETADAIEKKTGVADELLAQKEAERAKKRELEAEEEGLASRGSPPKRRRSYSSDSVSTISTRSPSPARANDPHRRRARPAASRDASPQASHERQRSVDSRDGFSHQPSVSPERAFSAKDKAPRRQRSISPYGGSQRQGRREAHTSKDSAELNRPNREYTRSTSTSRSRSRSRSRSWSPIRPPARPSSRHENAGAGQHRGREDGPRREDRTRPQQPTPPRQPSPPRQRSLSPFSKRLALTQAMNRGG